MTKNLEQAVFGLSTSTIPLPRCLAWKSSLKAVIAKVIPKMIGQQTPTSKNAVIVVMGK